MKKRIMAGRDGRQIRLCFMVAGNVTDDRVFGVLTCRRMEEFLDAGRLAAARARLAAAGRGVVLLYG